MTGIKYYSTSTKGVGGRIKERISDFVVREKKPDGTVCGITFDLEEKETPLKVPAKKDARENQLILEMEKFNLDLNDAVRRLTRGTGVSKKRVGFAGMKDKRAITSQEISFFDPPIERLEAFRSRYLRLRNPRWSDERVELGRLKGNEFEITIRGIELSEKEVKENIQVCFKEMEKGVLNYFGPQRFGGIRKVTHLVGKEFVKGSPEKAVMLYLTAVAPEEDEGLKNARMNLAKSHNFSKASNEFPVRNRYERAILHHLCRYPKDFVGAFRKLPRSLCYLFVHAYQSFLFNKIINKRIEEGIGLKEVDGDILQDGFPTAVLYGFESVLAEGKAGEIEKAVLEEEGTKLSDFKVKEMSEMSSKGSRKRIVLKPKNPKLLMIEGDELSEGKMKATVSFYLNKGNYATTILRELMKDE